MPEDIREAAPDAFEQVVLPHLDAAYNLARWLVRNPDDAEDIVQESYLRARRFFSGYRGGDSRAWMLKIVRNTSYSFLEKTSSGDEVVEFDETRHGTEVGPPDAEAALLKALDARMLREALEALPRPFRELVILRELEGLSYREIADILDVPIGTVMSGLARGRSRLRDRLLQIRAMEEPRGLPR